MANNKWNWTATKWATVMGILALAGGWLWNAATLSRNLSVNIAEDSAVHTKLQTTATENRESIIVLQSDLKYIREGIDEIKRELKK